MKNDSFGNVGLMATGVFIGAVGASLVLRRPPQPSALKHIGLPRGRACPAVIHNNTVFLSGQVPDIPTLATSDITAQTQQTLAKIDGLLEQCGTDRKHIVSTQVWVKDISRDFTKVSCALAKKVFHRCSRELYCSSQMNEVWNNWVGDESQLKGVRACVQSEMARENILVEIKVIAALPTTAL